MMNRTKVMAGTLGVLPLWTAGCGQEHRAAPQEESRRPNVVIFLTDDQGCCDVNRFGGADLLTPAMDRLCDEGVRFTQFYANSSISSPSRASLMTGRYPQRAGMGALASSKMGDAGMPASEVTLA
ncbi:MAG: sulfatase-like hydrolase/transferase, partial [Tannerella sp.]|nr:sulfatase-like hydrolase/transferase [Tannerella sp.]